MIWDLILSVAYHSAFAVHMIAFWELAKIVWPHSTKRTVIHEEDQ